jgi:hypothetical protein
MVSAAPSIVTTKNAAWRARVSSCARSEVSFAVLCRQPDIAIKLLTALGRELSVCIRYANLTIQQLET